MNFKKFGNGQGSFNPNQIKAAYDVDLVLCIDGTGSMGPIIEMTKKNALNLPDDLMQKANDMNMEITNLRIKIIVFRDYLADGEYAMQMTDFFNLPEEKKEMHERVSSIIASGGGDEPEDALEAIAYAMKSDWQPPRPGAKRRQIIAVWTDASAHELGYGKRSPYYDDMTLPADFDELTDWWGDEGFGESYMDGRSKRMAIFAPIVKPWTVLENNWDNVVHYHSEPGKGMVEAEYEEVINLLVKTIS